MPTSPVGKVGADTSVDRECVFINHNNVWLKDRPSPKLLANVGDDAAGAGIEMDTRGAAKRSLNWFLWWRIDRSELIRQVDQYENLPITKSARGISLLLLLFSFALTGVFIAIGRLDNWAIIDATLMLVLGGFIFKGHRWAIMAAMVLWTFEKASQLFLPASEGGTNNVVMPLLFWVVYMHAFYLAWKVESVRRAARNAPAEGTE